MAERLGPQNLSDKEIAALGHRKFFIDYASAAELSDIPVGFNGVARRLGNVLPDASHQDLSELLLGNRFDDDHQAWKAIKYAEAISAVKEFLLRVKEDEVEFRPSQDYINEIFLRVGVSAVDLSDAEAYSIRWLAEEHFEDPVNVYRFIALKEAVNSNISH